MTFVLLLSGIWVCLKDYSAECFYGSLVISYKISHIGNPDQACLSIWKLVGYPWIGVCLWLTATVVGLNTGVTWSNLRVPLMIMHMAAKFCADWSFFIDSLSSAARCSPKLMKNKIAFFKTRTSMIVVSDLVLAACFTLHLPQYCPCF